MSSPGVGGVDCAGTKTVVTMVVITTGASRDGVAFPLTVALELSIVDNEDINGVSDALIPAIGLPIGEVTSPCPPVSVL